MIGVNPITNIQNSTDADVKKMMRRGVNRLRPNTMMILLKKIPGDADRSKTEGAGRGTRINTAYGDSRPDVWSYGKYGGEYVSRSQWPAWLGSWPWRLDGWRM